MSEEFKVGDFVTIKPGSTRDDYRWIVNGFVPINTENPMVAGLAARRPHQHAILCRDNGSGKYEAAEVDIRLLERWFNSQGSKSVFPPAPNKPPKP